LIHYLSSTIALQRFQEPRGSAYSTFGLGITISLNSRRKSRQISLHHTKQLLSLLNNTLRHDLLLECTSETSGLCSLWAILHYAISLLKRIYVTRTVITRREATFAEYWKRFMARLNVVHAFSYTSAESEPIWVKFGARRVHSGKQRAISLTSDRPNFTKLAHKTWICVAKNHFGKQFSAFRI